MILYRLEVWNDWSDGAPEWDLSVWEDSIWISRINAERSLVDKAYSALQSREKERNRHIRSAVEHNKRFDDLESAGLDPAKFGHNGRRTVPQPFDWDDAVDTTLTDEAIGYRVTEFETED